MVRWPCSSGEGALTGASPDSRRTAPAEGIQVLSQGQPKDRRRKILVLVTEDWFAASHFIPTLEALCATGAEVAIATRISGKRAQLEATGARIVPFDFSRGPVAPLREMRVAWRLRNLVWRERPDAIHAISLKPISLIAGIRPIVPNHVLGIHLTGVGFAGTARSNAVGPIYRAALKMVVRELKRGGAHLFVENPDDAARLAEISTFPGDRVSILGGAGVDPNVFQTSPLPGQEPMRAGFVGRMVWTKGVDLLLGAHEKLTGQGVPLRIDLCGAPDPENPRTVPEETLKAWSARSGVTWRGRVEDIAGFWKSADICVVPSRGGEGLPRALLEAAACGRPIITTDVPGCRYFVRDGIEGLIVPPDDVDALAAALGRLIKAPELAQQMGNAARQRLLSGFTEDHVRAAVRSAYEKLLGLPSAAGEGQPTRIVHEETGS